jgi:hypothetical protein
MREIKFRAWDKKEQRIVTPILELGMKECVAFWHLDGVWFDPENIILMQYTGLKDKNGKEIYEGDIDNNRIVVWVDDEDLSEFVGWHWKDIYKNKYGEYEIHSFFAFTTPIEIIGNIYENPEMSNTVDAGK